MTLKDAVTIIKGKKPDALSEEFSDEMLPYLTADYFRTGKNKWYTSAKNNIVCNTDDVILIWDGSNAGEVFNGLNGVLASTMVKVTPSNEKFLNKYIYYLLKNNFYSLNSQTTGSTIPHVSRAVFDNINVPVISLKDQKEIVSNLDVINDAITACDKELSLEKERKLILLDLLFSHGTATNQADAITTKYGLVPAHWNIDTLENCAFIQTGAAMGRKFNNDKVVSLPYLRVANVQDGYLDLKEIKQIQIKESEIQRFSLQLGDVLVTEGGDFDKLGRGFLWENQIPNAVHQNHIFAIRVKDKILLSKFLAYLLQSRYARNYFLSVAHRTTNLASINSTKLKNFPMLIPTLNEQSLIVEILSGCDKKINALQKELHLLKEVFSISISQGMKGSNVLQHSVV